MAPRSLADRLELLSGLVFGNGEATITVDEIREELAGLSSLDQENERLLEENLEYMTSTMPGGKPLVGDWAHLEDWTVLRGNGRYKDPRDGVEREFRGGYVVKLTLYSEEPGKLPHAALFNFPVYGSPVFTEVTKLFRGARVILAGLDD